MKAFLILLSPLIMLQATAQKVYGLADKVENIAFAKIINNTSQVSSLNSINSEIIILDFFGTWCVPCLKALPHLSALSSQFKDKLSVLLISTEQSDRLAKFVAARQPFPFPVVADEESSFTNLFVPPSYPYTLVLDKERKIIAVTDAASITEQLINEWLAGKNKIAMSLSTVEKNAPLSTLMNSKKRSDNKLVALSQDFMYAAKTGDATGEFTKMLKNISYDELKNSLQGDNEKKAFWINAYNGYTQVLLRNDPAAYQHRGRFFGRKQIELAGKKFSLDDIEHGILRRSKIKWSLGYLNKWFPGKIEKQLRVDAVDYRIHFALNCGAKSCPPVAFYDATAINEQLEVATTAYLSGEAEYNGQKNTLALPAIMSWFRHDFGGKKKMLALVKQKGIVPENAYPKIHFTKYDWTLHLNNFQN